MKFTSENVLGVVVISILLALIIRYAGKTDHTITALSPFAYALTHELQGT